ncbi:cysteine hydrolase [Bradyrhizobium brasilense]|uniref:isochorismatase family cysteine hydrolase n=1 Tax=Bradyrhizobium brasilense TaxID=1419277 RepID=UPI0024B0B04D|nr:isochorismatase family cysteine hydrolase [Bradyrhizobium australafricanum]WFU31455.1 cysteine hydrolase [Bradyrhizobium australafricanum]
MSTTEPRMTREVPLNPKESALLFIDVQNFCIRRDGGEFKDVPDAGIAGRFGYYFDRLKSVAIPNMQRLQAAFRVAGIEVIYTRIENLTKDGRDRSLNYKIVGFNVPKGSWDGKVIDEIAPRDDEIVLAKSSSGVFVSTNIDYLLRNLGVRQLVLAGVVTDECVESAVRDACDLGYLVTLVPDACATYSQERHEHSLLVTQGYCRQVCTNALIDEIVAGCLPAETCLR